jgi:hypothetical protein
MSQAGRYRTFVQLDAYERWILRMMQYGISQGGKRKPPLSKVIGGIIREYWEQFEKDADPERLAELKKKVPPPRLKLMTMSLD